MSHFLDLIAYVAHICSDYDLKLSVFGDYSLDALYLFQALYISLSGIVQNKSHPISYLIFFISITVLFLTLFAFRP